MDGFASTGQTAIGLCNVHEVPDNGVLRVVVAGYPPLAVYNLNGLFYATEDRCSHGDGSLSAGFIEGDCIICPLHCGSFDIRTGRPVDPPCTREIATYTVVARSGKLMLIGS
jgi:nitrite reductase/ring-hydroxylating ferredoxin subunit